MSQPRYLNIGAQPEGAEPVRANGLGMKFTVGLTDVLRLDQRHFAAARVRGVSDDAEHAAARDIASAAEPERR